MVKSKYNKKLSVLALNFLLCAQRRTFPTGQVPNSSGSGKYIAVGKSVHREV